MVEIYKRNPEFIEAVQYYDDVSTLARISEFASCEISVSYKEDKKRRLKVFDGIGSIVIFPGDYLCKRANGSIFGMDKESFEIQYEKANKVRT